MIGHIASSLWHSATTALATNTSTGSAFGTNLDAASKPKGKSATPGNDTGASSLAADLQALLNQHKTGATPATPTHAATAYARTSAG